MRRRKDEIKGREKENKRREGGREERQEDVPAERN